MSRCIRQRLIQSTTAVPLAYFALLLQKTYQWRWNRNIQREYEILEATEVDKYIMKIKVELLNKIPIDGFNQGSYFTTIIAYKNKCNYLH